MKQCFSLFLILLSLVKPTFAAGFYPTAVVPGIHVGYIFNAGIALGAELNYCPIGIKSGNGKTLLGAYTGLTYFHSKGEIYAPSWYHTFSFGAMALSNNQFLFKAGACKSVLRWGRNNMNKTKSKGITPDIDLSYSPTGNGEYIGYRIFLPGNACFGLDVGVANMAYVAYRYNFAAEAFKKG
jgi:hypothetical protein